jgi:hypothetical protein
MSFECHLRFPTLWHAGFARLADCRDNARIARQALSIPGRVRRKLG